VFSSFSAWAQLEDRFSYLTDEEVSKYAQPLVTTLGVALNSAGYMSASVPQNFRLTFSLKAIAVFIPKEQQSFLPTLPDEYVVNKSTATIYGGKGSYYLGKNGYYVYPPGVNNRTIPVAFPQITFSVSGTELLLRILPSISIGGNKMNFMTAGIKYYLNQSLFTLPVDIAVQTFYTKLSISDIIDSRNFAVNAEASKTLGSLTFYGGLQYESSTLDLNYTITEDNFIANPGQQKGREVSAFIRGKNSLRATAGCAVKLSSIILNADFSFANQYVLTTGLSFAW
jgi:hypothetical protein